MKKIAIFVEGMTEQEFVVALITALVGERGIQFELARQWKGAVQITAGLPEGPKDFYILVVDCCSDGQVKTQIKERYQRLLDTGYTAILGLRDVYPLTKNDIPKIQAHLNTGIPIGAVIPKIYLAEMEVESWFIGESSHFTRLSSDLTIPFILQGGFDIVNKSGDSWSHPADVLDKIYKLVKKSYADSRGKKSKRRVQRTLRALSFDELYIRVQHQLPALGCFIAGVEAALF